jgi:hypothetical protein
MTPFAAPKPLVPLFLGLTSVAAALFLWRIYGPDPAAELRGPRLRAAHTVAIVAPPPPRDPCGFARTSVWRADIDEYRMVPALRRGALVGYRVDALRPGGALARRGVENGDVIARIDGMPLDSPEHARQLLYWVGKGCRARIDVERRGAPLQVVYEVVRGE